MSPSSSSLQDFADWVKFIGYPGPMTKTATSMYAKFIVPTMFAEVCKGKAPRAAMEEAETEAPCRLDLAPGSRRPSDG